jgi:hypothetical protein
LAGAAAAGALGAVEAAGPPEGVPVEAGWAGALVAGAGAAGSGAWLADAGPAVPEPVPAEPVPAELVPVELAAVELAPAEPVPAELAPAELVVELTGELEATEVADEPAEPADDAVEPIDEVADDAAEPTNDVADDAVEPTDEVADDVAEPTAEVTGDVAEPTVEATGAEAPESVDVRVALRGDRAAVAAWAGRENSSMTTKMPAAASAACTAVRAMRRTIGCMSSSHSTRTRPLAYPPAAEQTSHTRNCCSATTVRPDRRSDKGGRPRQGARTGRDRLSGRQSRGSQIRLI